MGPHTISRARREPSRIRVFVLFNDTATTEIYTLSLHDALPILVVGVAIGWLSVQAFRRARLATGGLYPVASLATAGLAFGRSGERPAELQPRQSRGCRLLVEKKTP